MKRPHCRRLALITVIKGFSEIEHLLAQNALAKVQSANVFELVH